LEVPLNKETVLDVEDRQDTVTGLVEPQDLDDVEAIFEQAHMNNSDTPIWPSSTGISLNRRNVPPQSKYATRYSYETAARKQWTPKKIRLNELAVDRLVLRMLLWMDLNGITEEAIEAVSRKQRNKFIRLRGEYRQMLEETEAKLRRTRATPVHSEEFEDLPLYCHYQHDGHGSHHEAATELDIELKRAFGRYNTHRNQGNLLMHICRKLTTCPVPPNVGCYNTILKGLCDHGLDGRLTSYVIRAMRESHIRMNEDSLIGILTHYRRSDDRISFVRFVGLMQGQNNGLALAKPSITVNEASEGRLVETDDQFTGERKIIQKPYQVPAVFNELLKGVLHFAGFRTAMEICQSMGSEGWGLSMLGMTTLLRNCVERADWESGRAVWDQIKLVQLRSRRRGVAEKIQLRTFVTMLHLCSMCEQEHDYDEIFNEAVLEGHARSGVLRNLRKMTKSFEDVARPTMDTSVRDNPESLNYVTGTAPADVIKTNNRRSEEQTNHDSTGRGGNRINAVRYTDDPVNDTVSEQTREHDYSTQSTSQSRQTSQRQHQDPIRQEQLWGNMAASQDLDIYENTERPMGLYL